MKHVNCPCCGLTLREDVVLRLARRKGQMEGNGFFWQKNDINLLADAIEEIHQLRHPEDKSKWSNLNTVLP